MLFHDLLLLFIFSNPLFSLLLFIHFNLIHYISTAFTYQSPISMNSTTATQVLVKGVEYLFTPTSGLSHIDRINHTGYGNLTLLQDDSLCTPSTCDLSLAQLNYKISIGGNALFAALFGIMLVVQMFLGSRYKTWGYSTAMILGLFGEIIGYIGRILLSKSPFDPTGNDFLIYLVPLTIAPALLSAAIFLCLARIIIVYGEQISRLAPRFYTLLFCSFDIISLLLQAIGGALASTANTNSDLNLGVHIMITGLSFQVFSLTIFVMACIDVGHCIRKTKEDNLRLDTAHLYQSKLFKSFLAGLIVATLTILTRCAYRVAELSGGFKGPLANDQVTFMILEGTMVIIACICLTVFHPGICFQGHWSDANFKLFRKSKVDVKSSPTSSSVEFKEVA